jgi:hypothetical protein
VRSCSRSRTDPAAQRAAGRCASTGAVARSTGGASPTAHRASRRACPPAGDAATPRALWSGRLGVVAPVAVETLPRGRRGLLAVALAGGRSSGLPATGRCSPLRHAAPLTGWPTQKLAQPARAWHAADPSARRADLRLRCSTGPRSPEPACQTRAAAASRRTTSSAESRQSPRSLAATAAPKRKPHRETEDDQNAGHDKAEPARLRNGCSHGYRAHRDGRSQQPDRRRRLRRRGLGRFSHRVLWLLGIRARYCRRLFGHDSSSRR